MESKTVPGIKIVSMDESIEYCETVKLAREMSQGDKMMLGLEMFDVACDDVCAKIKAHFPSMTKDAADKLLGVLIERSKLR